MQASTTEMQEIEERISDAEDSIEIIDSTVKENAKCKKLVTQSIQEIQDTMRRPNNEKGQQISSIKLWKKTSLT